MTVAADAPAIDLRAEGVAMHRLVTELYPICRSITGDGVRETLHRLGEVIPLTVHEVPTGTKVLDWVVPREWNVRDAYVKNGRGERVIDFRRHNLHLVSYSRPVHREMSLAELRPHLHSLPEHPDWIPYRTSYYDETWGFCLTDRQLQALPDDTYEVCVDATLRDGHLTYGECFLPGERPEEVLISCHVCHPSLANDNLSGIALVTHLARVLAERHRRLSYRFLFVPVTIGAITWLARNLERVRAVRHGLVVACVGDPGHKTYKRSRRGDAEIDRAVAHVLAHSGEPYDVVDFVPYGYDERQYCSPGFDLPVGCLMRTPHGQYREYHTSADDPSLVRPEALADSLATYLAVTEVLEHNRRFVNLCPFGEPQLGRRGLYRQPWLGDPKQRQLAMLWVLNLSDGTRSLLDVAERSGLPFAVIREAATALWEHDLLAECPEER